MHTVAVLRPIKYSPEVEAVVETLTGLLKGKYPLSSRAVAVLALQNDAEAIQWINELESRDVAEQVHKILAQAKIGENKSIAFELSIDRQTEAESITKKTLIKHVGLKHSFGRAVGRICMHPFWGLPIVLAVLYFGMYLFVGVFGGGIVVDYIESVVFGEYINPHVVAFFNRIITYQPLNSLFVGEFGIWTLGITYAFALILPIVGFFFLVFSILEDSGYLPRLAMLVDRLFKWIGLNGRAVIPIVLGFGCDTMATLVTRALETRRERIITTFLLSLIIPCSAQLSVILTLMAHHPKAIVIWGVFGGIIFLVAGFLASKVVTDKPAGFYMELPPMRFPHIGNILVKTASRMHWYFLEVCPLFILASVLIWLGQITHLFDAIIAGLQPVVVWLDLPKESAAAFLFGFFRRDYGAAGLYSIDKVHALTGNQMLISAVMLTLFLPCVAQLMIVKKERGWKMAAGMVVITLATAFAAGLFISRMLRWTGVEL